MIEIKKSELAKMDAPFNKQLKLEDMAYEGGMNLMRVTIKEGARFTQLDLDPDTAKSLARHMVDWADKQPDT